MKFGHRGAPGRPRRGENTISSFQKALDSGANGIELDVRRTRDGKLAVIHDETVNRTTDGLGAVSDLTYSELEKFDAGGGDHIPLLLDVLKTFGKQCTIDIELKDSGIALEVKELIIDLGLADSVIVSAFDKKNRHGRSPSWEELKIFRPEIPIAILASKKKIRSMGERAYVETTLKLGASAVNPETTAVTETLINLAQNAGLKVYSWTANRPAIIAKLKSMGVDGLFSDFPERL